MVKKQDLTGGNLSDLPNEQYEKFFAKFSEIDHLPVEDWKVVHILGHFCKKYREAYGVDYKFKFNNPSPTKSFEVFQIKKLAMQLTSNPALLKEYIDWIFETRVKQAKRKLTSISFMTVEGIVNDYKLNVLLSGKQELSLDRSSVLPEKYKSVFAEVGVKLNNYGDLAFLSQMIDQPSDIILAFNKIEELGFDRTILDRII
jgi:hypothetical protein